MSDQQLANPRKLCRHCQQRTVNRPRGLCWSCYYQPGVREQYDAMANQFVPQDTGRGANTMLDPNEVAPRPTRLDRLRVLVQTIGRQATIIQALNHLREDGESCTEEEFQHIHAELFPPLPDWHAPLDDREDESAAIDVSGSARRGDPPMKQRLKPEQKTRLQAIVTELGGTASFTEIFNRCRGEGFEPTQATIAGARRTVFGSGSDPGRANAKAKQSPWYGQQKQLPEISAMDQNARLQVIKEAAERHKVNGESNGHAEANGIAPDAIVPSAGKGTGRGGKPNLEKREILAAVCRELGPGASLKELLAASKARGGAAGLSLIIEVRNQVHPLPEGATRKGRRPKPSRAAAAQERPRFPGPGYEALGQVEPGKLLPVDPLAPATSGEPVRVVSSLIEQIATVRRLASYCGGLGNLRMLVEELEKFGGAA